MAYSGYCPPTVTVYNWATIKVLIYLYFEYYPTVTEWGQYPRFGGIAQYRYIEELARTIFLAGQPPGP